MFKKQQQINDKTTKKAKKNRKNILVKEVKFG